MEIHESGGDGSMLEEVGGENGGRPSGQAQGREQQQRVLQRQRCSVGMEACAKKQEVQDSKMERIAGQESSTCSESTTCSRLQSMHEDSTEGEEMKRQQRKKVMRDMTKKMRSKGKGGFRKSMVCC